MNNDLISRDALRKAFHKRIHHFDKSSWDEANALINDAPTVEEKSYAMGYQDGAEDGLQDIRPHGKWEEPFERKGKTYHKCSKCHVSNELTLFDNFCPFCGADMREEGDKNG